MHAKAVLEKRCNCWRLKSSIDRRILQRRIRYRAQLDICPLVKETSLNARFPEDSSLAAVSKFLRAHHRNSGFHAAASLSQVAPISLIERKCAGSMIFSHDGKVKPLGEL